MSIIWAKTALTINRLGFPWNNSIKIHLFLFNRLNSMHYSADSGFLGVKVSARAQNGFNDAVLEEKLGNPPKVNTSWT